MQYTLGKTEGAINNGKFRETGNIAFTRHKPRQQNKKTQHRILQR